MSSYITTPLTFREGLVIDRRAEATDDKEMIDRLINLIVYTPRGRFLADPDFGFEYWNHEYVNANYKSFYEDFNNGHNVAGVNRKRCEESIRQSLLAYAPQLRNVKAELTIRPNTDPMADTGEKGATRSKVEVMVIVKWEQEEEIGTGKEFETKVTFFMER